MAFYFYCIFRAVAADTSRFDRNLAPTPLEIQLFMAPK